MKENEKRISKQLSYVLRHGPRRIGVTLEKSGWVSVEILLSQLTKYGKGISPEVLESVVANNSKQHFEFSEDSAKMDADGSEFYLTGNDVWLTDSVPAQYLKVVITTRE